MSNLDLEATLERIQDAWREELAYSEWAAFQLEELRERLKITDDMIERAANAIWYGQLPDDPPWEEQKNIARHALEAVLKEDE